MAKRGTYTPPEKRRNRDLTGAAGPMPLLAKAPKIRARRHEPLPPRVSIYPNN